MFQDLKQVTGVRFKTEMKEAVAGLFQWDNEILCFLENKQGTMVEKKNRMVCYFFLRSDLMIGLRQNLSRNPGLRVSFGNN